MSGKEIGKRPDKHGKDQEQKLDERVRQLEQILSLQKEQVRLLKQLTSKKRYYISD